jgi:peptide/nickel transport system permease protein
MPRLRTVWNGLPIVHQFKQSIGLQRGMLVTGLVITGFFLLVAALAPVISPYGFNELRDANGLFGAQVPPTCSERLPGATTCFRG